ELASKLIGEMPGIFNWAIAGWRQLQKRGHFEQPKTGLGLIKELGSTVSLIQAWFEERCEMRGNDDVGSKCWCTCQEAYDSFRDWLERNGEKPWTNTRFGRDIKAALNVAKHQVGDGPKRGQRVYRRADDGVVLSRQAADRQQKTAGSK